MSYITYFPNTHFDVIYLSPESAKWPGGIYMKI
jgi:hypothetical protein